MYVAKQKMSDLMTEHPELLEMIGLFDISMGVENYTIQEICDRQGVDCDTFLALIHYRLYRQTVDPRMVDVPTLQRFIDNGHTFYVKSLLPRMRQLLIEAVNLADETSKVPVLILQFYDDYVRQIKNHIHHEKSGTVGRHEEAGNQHIAKKLTELTNLIIKYYPQREGLATSPLIHTLVTMLYATEQEILIHCDIEDQVLIPALKASQHEDSSTEELTDRERDVLIEVVKGFRNKEIADHLCLSIHTVLSHRKNIAHKLDIHSTSGLTIYALVNHLVELDALKN